MANVIVWADIPVVDLKRARAFYAHLLGTPVDFMEGSEEVAVLKSPGDTSMMDVSADLAPGRPAPLETPGVTIYLSSQGDIDGMLARAVEAGGKILESKMHMEMIGWMAFIQDAECNRIGIHEPDKSAS